MSAVRLIVGSRDGMHGLSWRVWVRGNDIYIKARALQGSLKVSVHPPGPMGPNTAFFYGLDESWLVRHPDGMEPVGSPRIEQYWPRELGPGVRRIASIRVHPEAIASDLPIDKPDSHLWVEPPLPNRTVELHVLLFERHQRARDWFGRHTPGLLCGIVDETVLGDVLIYGMHEEAGQPPIYVQAESVGGPPGPGEAEAVAFGIDPRDQSLILDECPVRVDYPHPQA